MSLNVTFSGRFNPIAKAEKALERIHTQLTNPTVEPRHYRRRDELHATPLQELTMGSDLGLEDHFQYVFPRPVKPGKVSADRVTRIFRPPLSPDATSPGTMANSVISTYTELTGEPLGLGMPNLNLIQMRLGIHPFTKQSQDVSVHYSPQKPDEDLVVQLHLTSPTGKSETNGMENYFEALTPRGRDLVRGIVRRMEDLYRAQVASETASGKKPLRVRNFQEMLNRMVTEIVRYGAPPQPETSPIFKIQFPGAVKVMIPGKEARITPSRLNTPELTPFIPPRRYVIQKRPSTQVQGAFTWTLLEPGRDIRDGGALRLVEFREVPKSGARSETHVTRVKTARHKRGEVTLSPSPMKVRVHRKQLDFLKTKSGLA